MAGEDTKLSEIGSISTPSGGAIYIVINGVSYQISYTNLISFLMQAAVYDPSGKNADAFNSANHSFTASGITATNTQSAIIEVNGKVKKVIAYNQTCLEADNPNFITFPGGQTIQGANYEVMPRGVDAEGFVVGVQDGAKSNNGFYVNVDADCVVIYIATER